MIGLIVLIVGSFMLGVALAAILAASGQQSREEEYEEHLDVLKTRIRRLSNQTRIAQAESALANRMHTLDRDEILAARELATRLREFGAKVGGDTINAATARALAQYENVRVRNS